MYRSRLVVRATRTVTAMTGESAVTSSVRSERHTSRAGWQSSGCPEEHRVVEPHVAHLLGGKDNHDLVAGDEDAPWVG